MQQRAVLLSGEHPTLPKAELRALLDVHDPGASATTRGLVAFITPADEAGTDRALERMALAHEWGLCWGEAPDTGEGLADLAALVRERAHVGGPPGREGGAAGTAAVEAERRGRVGRSTRDLIERQLGGALRDAGHSIDLVAPAFVVFAWLENGVVVVGEKRGTHDRGQHEHRISDERAHFSPVSLHPRRAASLLHLARVPPGGRVYDPFCGTGAFVLEAAIEGYDAWGSDLDAFMVQGTLQTLADTTGSPLDGAAFVADVAEGVRLLDGTDGIVTDLPYGRASSSHDEDLAALYDRGLAAFSAALPDGGYAVVGSAQPELLAPEPHGLEVKEHHVERVHRSLTRHFLVLRKESVKRGTALEHDR